VSACYFQTHALPNDASKINKSPIPTTPSLFKSSEQVVGLSSKKPNPLSSLASSE
jgi:hypothetical protein